MFEKLEIFCIPDNVSSNKGPHFAGGWWKTLCALHGVKTAYSQAYHHQANGRAESSGQFVIKKGDKLSLKMVEPGLKNYREG